MVLQPILSSFCAAPAARAPGGTLKHQHLVKYGFLAERSQRHRGHFRSERKGDMPYYINCPGPHTDELQGTQWAPSGLATRVRLGGGHRLQAAPEVPLELILAHGAQALVLGGDLLVGAHPKVLALVLAGVDGHVGEERDLCGAALVLRLAVLPLVHAEERGGALAIVPGLEGRVQVRAAPALVRVRVLLLLRPPAAVEAGPHRGVGLHSQPVEVGPQQRHVGVRELEVLQELLVPEIRDALVPLALEVEDKGGDRPRELCHEVARVLGPPADAAAVHGAAVEGVGAEHAVPLRFHDDAGVPKGEMVRPVDGRSRPPVLKLRALPRAAGPPRLPGDLLGCIPAVVGGDRVEEDVAQALHGGKLRERTRARRERHNRSDTGSGAAARRLLARPRLLSARRGVLCVPELIPQVLRITEDRWRRGVAIAMDGVHEAVELARRHSRAQCRVGVDRRRGGNHRSRLAGCRTGLRSLCLLARRSVLLVPELIPHILCGPEHLRRRSAAIAMDGVHKALERAILHSRAQSSVGGRRRERLHFLPVIALSHVLPDPCPQSPRLVEHIERCDVSGSMDGNHDRRKLARVHGHAEREVGIRPLLL
eukprot:scaffold28410_cov55-Phaeocystis_antarctica.AAC.3